MRTRHGVDLEVVWEDDQIDMVHLNVHAANHDFSASSKVYTSRKALRALADELKGFPGPNRSEVTFTAEDPHAGTLRLRFFCRKSAQRVAVQVEIDGPLQENEEIRDRAQFVLALEGPGAIDAFRESLYMVSDGKQTHAEIAAPAF